MNPEAGRSSDACVVNDSAGRGRPFDTYLFADYSGHPDEAKQRGSIAVWVAHGSEQPRRETRDGSGFTRSELREFIVKLLKIETAAGRRVIFGFDHQLSWPLKLWSTAKAEGTWRERLNSLVRGDGRPTLTTTTRATDYMAAFNHWASGSPHTGPFYLKVSTGTFIGRVIPVGWQSLRVRLRLTELDAGGGFPATEFGKDRVAGQTLCGLPQLHALLADCQKEEVRVACWPFDGLSISHPAYAGAHVCVEVYPSLYPEGGWEEVDGADAEDRDSMDAWRSCCAVQRADQDGNLAGLMDLSVLTPELGRQVAIEGWIFGVIPPMINLSAGN
jgi:hypothetical protein